MAGLVSPEFSLTATRPNIAQQLGFVAKAVVVDNYTTSYVRVRGAQRDVPPLVFGVVLSISGTQVAEAQLVATTPAPFSPPTPSAAASLTFYEDALPAQVGHVLQTSQYTPRGVLYPDGVPAASQVGPSFTVGVGASVSKNFTLPAGTVDLRVLVVGAVTGAIFPPVTLEIFGNTTGGNYYPGGRGSGAGNAWLNWPSPLTVPVDVALDANVAVIVNNQGTSQLSVYVAPTFTSEATQVWAQAPLPTFDYADDFTVRTAIAAFSVAGGGGRATLLGPFSFSLQLRSYSFFQDGANAVGRFQLVETVTSQLIHDMFCNATRGRLDEGYLGHPLTGSGAVNTGVDVINGGGAASFFGGRIEWRIQGPPFGA